MTRVAPPYVLGPLTQEALGEYLWDRTLSAIFGLPLAAVLTING